MMARRAFVVAILLAVTSHAAVLCTSGSGSGTVRVRATCRPREVQLDPVALGLQGPTGAAGPAGPTGQQGPQGDPGQGGARVEFTSTSGTPSFGALFAPAQSGLVPL